MSRHHDATIQGKRWRLAMLARWRGLRVAAVPAQDAALAPAGVSMVAGMGQAEETLTMLTVIETLPPDPLTGFYYDRAHREGWTLSETCDLTGRPAVQLQALDCEALPSGVATLLPSDRDAWGLVMCRARRGSGLHRDALARIDDVERAMIEAVFGPL